MRTIFISHSAKSAEHTAYLTALADGLSAKGFEVWLDRDSLAGGDDWNRKIGNALVYCQGAVVLVSQQSLASPYVQHELSNLLLRWRRERDPRTGDAKFPLALLLLSDDVIGDLEKGFSKAVRLTDVNYISACPVEGAIEKLERSFAGIADFDEANSPLADAEIQITSILDAPNLTRILKRAAKEAGFPATTGASSEAAALEVARYLLMRPLDAVYRFLATLGAAITAEQRRNLFHLAAPGWVSPEAARRLSEAIAAKPPLACIVNAELTDFTPGMYLRRTRLTLPTLAGHVIGVRGATAALAAAQLRRGILIAVADRLKVDGDPSEPQFEPAVRTEIQRFLAAAQRPILVAIPVVETDLDLIPALRVDPVFEGVTFMALCVEATAASATPELVWLDPQLHPEQEHAAFKTHNTLIQTLSQT